MVLKNLPDKVYETKWDLIMIETLRGYFVEEQGRMGAIFLTAIMARNKMGSSPN